MATLKQVAQIAGVSISTASKVLNKSAAAAEISAQTQELVLRAARKVNYIAHPIAHSLRTSTTHTIGFISPYIPDAHLSPILRSVQDVLDRRGYRLLISVTERDAEREVHWVEYFRHRVDGLIVAGNPSPEQSEDVGGRLRKEDIPTVFLGMESNTPGIPSAIVDGFGGARRAVEHLIELGHRRIGFLGGRTESYENRVRFGGYQAALQAAQIPLEPELVMENTKLTDYGYANATMLISRAQDLTAIFTFNDSMALGAIRASVDLGRRVPEDLSVVGFDDLAWVAHICPPLTTVRQPREELGLVAATLLLEVIARRDRKGKPVGDGDDKMGQTVVLETELVIRASTAPPRNR